MKLIAHRGWSAGEIENTLNAFAKAARAREVSGVEIDVRWGPRQKRPIVSHDPAEADQQNNTKLLPLNHALDVLARTTLDIYIELKEYDDRLFSIVTNEVQAYGLEDRTCIFAFKSIAQQFPWKQNQGDIKLGLISLSPVSIPRDITRYQPDVVLLGFNDRWWSHALFKTVWSPPLLSSFIEYYSPTRFVAGVSSHADHYRFFRQVEGLHSITVDFPIE